MQVHYQLLHIMFLSQKFEYQKPLLTKCYLTWHKFAILFAYFLYHKTQSSVPASMRNLFLSTYVKLEEVNFSMITNDARCTHDIKAWIDTKRSVFNKKDLFSSKQKLNLRKKLVNCYIWSRVCMVLKTWTLQKIHQKYLGSTQMWCWRKMEKISGTNCVKYDVLHRVKEESSILQTIKRRRLNGLVTSSTETAF